MEIFWYFIFSCIYSRKPIKEEKLPDHVSRPPSPVPLLFLCFFYRKNTLRLKECISYVKCWPPSARSPPPSATFFFNWIPIIPCSIARSLQELFHILLKSRNYLLKVAYWELDALEFYDILLNHQLYIPKYTYIINVQTFFPCQNCKFSVHYLFNEIYNRFFLRFKRFHYLPIFLVCSRTKSE